MGHNFWEHVRELDLSRSKIRELEGLQGSEFVNLRELNLDSNLLSAAADLPHLPAIAVLRLNHNLIATPTADRLSPPVGGGGGGGGGGGADADADATGGPLQCGIGSLVTLEVLRLGYNLISDLPLTPTPTPTPTPTRTAAPHQVLQLGYNQISDLPALRLHGLLQLKVLHLQGNELVRVDGLGSLLQAHA